MVNSLSKHDGQGDYYIRPNKTKKVTTSRGDHLDQGMKTDTHCFQLIIAMDLEVGLHPGIFLIRLEPIHHHIEGTLLCCLGLVPPPFSIDINAIPPLPMLYSTGPSHLPSRINGLRIKLKGVIKAIFHLINEM